MLAVKVKKIHDNAVIPHYANPGDAGMDICSVVDATILPGGISLIPTGIALELPPNTEAQIRPRSGLALKNGITVLNSPGTIDEGYRGELKVILINHGKEPFHVAPGMRIAQMVIQPVLTVSITEVADVSESARGDGGFGSSGI